MPSFWQSTLNFQQLALDMVCHFHEAYSVDRLQGQHCIAQDFQRQGCIALSSSGALELHYDLRTFLFSLLVCFDFILPTYSISAGILTIHTTMEQS